MTFRNLLTFSTYHRRYKRCVGANAPFSVKSDQNLSKEDQTPALAVTIFFRKGDL